MSRRGSLPARRTAGSHAQPAAAVLEPPDWFRRLLQRERKALWVFAAVALVLLLAVLVFALMEPGRNGERESCMNQAAASYAAGDYDAALRMLRKAAQIRQDDACLLLMADCYEAQGNLDKALELLRQIKDADQSVTARIDELEKRKQSQAQEGKLTVAGRQLPADLSSLNLDGLDLDDTVLPQVAQFYALSDLSMMNNRLQDLSALSVLGGLDTLNLAHNRISDLRPLAALQNLRTLYLDENPISDLRPLYGLSGLTMLSVCGTELSVEDLDALAAALPNCVIHSDATSSAAREITIGGMSFSTDTEELDLSDRNLHDISALAQCRHLKWLKLSDNNIGDLTALMNLPQLESLDISNNLVTDLRPLMGLSALRHINASGNRIQDTAAVGAMTELSSLDLSRNPIRDFSGLRKLRVLHNLRLVNTGITDDDLPYLESLSLLASLWLDENPGLSNEAMGQLQYALPNCTITYTQLVYTVMIGDQEIDSDSTVLYYTGGELVDLAGFDRMSCLEQVDLSHNRISNIYLLQYSPSRDTIKKLNLSYNDLTDITALSSLTAVESLDLRGNRIPSVMPLLNLNSLRYLYLEGNPLSQEQIEQLRSALPLCEILFEEQ